MSIFDPGTFTPSEPDDTEPPTPADLSVDYMEPVVTATLYAVDGTPLLELTDRSPAGF